jgi:4-amino-4-deoxy-L-arabinose transferase-like glycosyltransferase
MAPLYPLLLARIFRITGILSWASYLVIGYTDCAFSALTAWPAAAVARKAFGETTGIAAGWFWALLPTAVYYPVAWVWDTCLVTLLFALVVLATLYLRDSARSAAWAGYGLLLGITALVNAAVVSTYPFFLGWAALQIRRRTPNWMRLAAMACAGCVLVLSPWWVRNYVVFHRFIPLRSNFGLELWLGNNPRNPDIWAWWLHPDSDEGAMQEMVRMGEMAFMDAKQKEALAWIRSHPGDFLRDSFDRLADTWVAFDEPIWQVLRMHPFMRWLYLASAIFPVVTFSGAWLAARRRNPYMPVFGAVLLAFPLIYYVTHSSLRYRYPIEPVMSVLCAYALVSLVSAFRPRREEASAAGAGHVAGEMTPAS